MRIAIWVRWAAAVAVAACALPAGATLDKLQATRVPLLALLIEAFEVEGESYNLSNGAAAGPAFHSARWNPGVRTLEWRFIVRADGMLAGKLRALSRDEAAALLTHKMKELAVFVGLEAMPGYDRPMGCLDTVNVPGRSLVSEADWTAARRELAAASVIRLAAPHAGGPIMLVRSADGRVSEAPVAAPAAPAGRRTR
jgi:hypothetical protein